MPELALIAIDRVGNRSLLNQTVLNILPDTAPDVVISSVNLNSVKPDDVVSVTVSANDDVELSSISFTANGGAVASDFEMFTGVNTETVTFEFIVPVMIDESTIRLQAGAQDSVGNVGVAPDVILDFQADQEPPTIMLFTVDGQNVVEPASQILLRTVATDNLGLAEISVAASDLMSESRTLLGETDALEFFTLDIPNDAALGSEISVMAGAEDVAGNSAFSDVLTLVVGDLTPPQVDITSPMDNSIALTGQPLTVEVSASDAFGIQSIRLQVTGAFNDVQEFTYAPSVSPVNQAFDIPLPDTIRAGSRISLIATAIDHNNMSFTSEVVTLTIEDGLPPAVSEHLP